MNEGSATSFSNVESNHSIMGPGRGMRLTDAAMHHTGIHCLWDNPKPKPIAFVLSMNGTYIWAFPIETQQCTIQEFDYDV